MYHGRGRWEAAHHRLKLNVDERSTARTRCPLRWSSALKAKVVSETPLPRDGLVMAIVGVGMDVDIGVFMGW